MIYVLTSDSYAWLLRGFLHQWNKYDRRSITVAGFTHPGKRIIGDTPFLSLGNFKNYPVDRWSDGLIKLLQVTKDDLVEIYLEDYWLMRSTNQQATSWAYEYMRVREDVLRMDLSSDRLYAKSLRDAESIDCVDFIEAKGQYSLSFQASIWRKAALLDVLEPGETPWQTELNGTERVNASPWRVMGTRQWPVKYQIVVNKGQLDRAGHWMFPPRSLSESDWAELDKLGCTRP